MAFRISIHQESRFALPVICVFCAFSKLSFQSSYRSYQKFHKNPSFSYSVSCVRYGLMQRFRNVSLRLLLQQQARSNDSKKMILPRITGGCDWQEGPDSNLLMRRWGISNVSDKRLELGLRDKGNGCWKVCLLSASGGDWWSSAVKGNNYVAWPGAMLTHRAGRLSFIHLHLHLQIITFLHFLSPFSSPNSSFLYGIYICCVDY